MLARIPRCRAPPLSSIHRCTLFSLPDLSSFAPPGLRGPQRYNDSKILPYTPKQMYDVVSDVSSYPKFVPFCTSSRILTTSPKANSQGQQVLDAELTVGFLSFKESYVSTVTCVPHQTVEAVATSSTPLFKALSTTWSFQPQQTRTNATPSTLVSLDLVYDFANPLHAAVSSQFFGQVSQLMIKAFEDRCYEVYRRRP
ncbi:dehydrase and lipid transport-domain-containing protein [Coprinopsis sp. MPI-PUGE-AT-0042]|nr:dehydrase and lipid transport-domain-containing protein [Coprinopsis sp. MPI-PUGE-AT-0042]